LLNATKKTDIFALTPSKNKNISVKSIKKKVFLKLPFLCKSGSIKRLRFIFLNVIIYTREADRRVVFPSYFIFL